MEENGKYVDIKETTIEGLVQRLIDVKYVDSKEEDTLRDSLKQATRKFENDDQIKAFMLGLSAEIRESPSSIFTPTGINVAALKVVLDNVTKVVEKDSKVVIQSEQVVQDSAVDISSFDERIENEASEYLGKMDKMLADLGLDDGDLAFSPEEKIETAKKMAKIGEYWRLYHQARKEGKTKEEAERFASSGSGIKTEDIDSSELATANAMYVKARFDEEVEKNGGDVSKAFENLQQNNAEMLDSVLSQEEQDEAARHGNYNDAFKKVIERSRTQELIDKKSSEITNYEDSISAYAHAGADLDIESLISSVNKSVDASARKYKYEKKLREITGTPLDDRRRAILEEITRKYIATDELSISDIFDDMKSKGQADGIEFDEVLDFIKTDADQYLQLGAVNGASNLMILENAEREIRKLTTIIDTYDMSMKGVNGKGGAVRRLNREKVESLRKRQQELKSSITKLKNELRKAKGIEKEEYTESDRDEMIEHRKEILINKSRISSGQAIRDKNDVSRDRNEIILLSKSENISMSEAARRYFKENPKRIKQYSLTEQDVLLGNDTPENLGKKPNRISRFLTNILKSRNDRVITSLTHEIEEYQDIVEAASMHDLEDSRLSAALKAIEKRKEALAKAEQTADRLSGKKDAQSIMHQKEKQAILSVAFRRYIESGKTINEILEELRKNGEIIDISRYDLLQEIRSNEEKYISPVDVDRIFVEEKKNSDLEIKIQALTILKANAEKANNTKLVSAYEKEIGMLRGKIAENQSNLEGIRAKAAKKLGLNPRENSPQQEELDNTEHAEVSEAKGEPSEIKVTNMNTAGINKIDERPKEQSVDAAKIAEIFAVTGDELSDTFNELKGVQNEIDFKNSNLQNTTVKNAKKTTKTQEAADEITQ